MPHKVDAAIIEWMMDRTIKDGVNPSKHDRAVGHIVQSFQANWNCDSMDFSSIRYHAHVAVGRVAKKMKETKEKGGDNMNRKYITIRLGKLVTGGMMIKIINLSGDIKSKIWKTNRRKHNLAVADFLVSPFLTKLTVKTRVDIVISKKA